MPKSFGLFGLAEAVMSGQADPMVAQQRMAICLQCQETDSQGQRIVRQGMSGHLWCGLPRLQNIYRDEVADGCGCLLSEKVQFNSSACPRGKW
jgi:hypothetical protein